MWLPDLLYYAISPLDVLYYAICLEQRNQPNRPSAWSQVLL